MCIRDRELVKPPIIVIGSHVDVAKSQGKQMLSEALNELPHLNTSITVDCTRKSSPGLTEISTQISTYSKKHRQLFSVSAQIHFLNRLLQEKFKDRIACQLSEISDSIAHEDNAMLRKNELLPIETSSLSEQLSKLSEHGQVLYFKDSKSITDSWIVLKKEVLLSEVNGSIFAPKEFESVYKDFGSTGVIALSKIEEVFPQYDPQMLMSFMTLLDFCHEIGESEISIISSKQSESENNERERYYVFPALVSIEHPTEDCQSILSKSYKFGWCLHCKRNAFLTSRFLHVLLLRLAFTYALPAASPPTEEHSLGVERRQCNVWKNGIHWLNMDGVEAIVEVVEQNTAVVVVMGCLERCQVRCIQLRSAVIETILSAKEQFSGSVDVEESFLHPDELTVYPLKDVKSLYTFPISALAKAISERGEALTNKIGQRQEMIKIDTLLYFEPYTCLSEGMIANLIKESDTNKEISDNFLRECAKVAHPKLTHLKEILLLPEHNSEYVTAVEERRDQFSNDSTHKCFHVFTTWKKFTKTPTYRGLREALDNYSIFRGRNPLVSDMICYFE